MIFLALDWAKAFDSISPACLSKALLRFGIPEPFIEMVNNIYDRRSFFVADSGQESDMHVQHFGISQGCLLSPFLFIIVMTILMEDARDIMRDIHGDILDNTIPFHDLLYADDTLLIDATNSSLQQYMEIVEELGRTYGLKLNWKKVEVLPARCEAQIYNSEGGIIGEKDSFVYLGAMICNDGKIDAEINRRLGMATADFKCLRRIWNHTYLSCKAKFNIYMACIVSKLMYGLQTSWLSKTQRRKLDGFHARALRQISGIRPSFLSRISNEEILQKFYACKLSNLLLEQQLLYFGKIARMPNDAPIRQLIFENDSIRLKRNLGRRRRGRPRLSWSHEVYRHLGLAVGDINDIQYCIYNIEEWRGKIRLYCRSNCMRPLSYI